MKKLAIGVLSSLLCLASCFSSAAELRNNHPEFHVVQPGDTLWDISEKFLSTPWLWPEIWHVNDQVENPHLIFPGDIIALVYVDGQPRITKTNRYPDGTIKLSPRSRELEGEQAISTLPLDAILPFLNSALVLSPKEIEMAPYVVGGDSGRLLAAQNNKVYVRGIDDFRPTKYSFFRQGDRYVDPETNELLGIEAIHVAEGSKVQSGDPTVIKVDSSEVEIRTGDRALPTNDDQLRPVYFPRAPESMKDGQIISVYNGVEQIGQWDVVVINRGDREGMEVGHVLDIYQKGKTIVDKIATERRQNDDNIDNWTKLKEAFSAQKQKVTLPDEYAGRMMIFRTFDKVSLGLVLKSERSIHILDKVKVPL